MGLICYDEWFGDSDTVNETAEREGAALGITRFSLEVMRPGRSTLGWRRDGECVGQRIVKRMHPGRRKRKERPGKIHRRCEGGHETTETAQSRQRWRQMVHCCLKIQTCKMEGLVGEQRVREGGSGGGQGRKAN